MIRRITEFLLTKGLPKGETGESIRADLREELAELKDRHPGRSFRFWLLWEAAKLTLHFSVFRLEVGPQNRQDRNTTPSPGEGFMGSLSQDLRFAFRTLRRRAVYSTVAILTLGLGIGAATAMFSVVDGVLIRSVPFGDPSEIVNVWLTSESARGGSGLIAKTWNRVPLSPTEFRSWQAENTAFESVAVHNAIETTLTGEDSSERVRIGYGSASLLTVLGVQPVMGRWFLPSEEGPGSSEADPVTVISYETWRDRLGSDPGVLGRTLTLDGRVCTIIGVMPEGFRLRYLGMHWLGEDKDGVRDVWAPLGAKGIGSGNNLEAIARLAPGVSMERTLTEATTILLRERNRGEVRIVPRTEDETSGLGSPLVLLLAATGLLLLIGCANIATLSLGELHGRASELSTRGALGAGKGRIVRQLLVESLVVGMLGTGVGVLLAFGGTEILIALAPPLPRIETVGVDPRVLGFAAGVGVLAGVLFGTLPAFVSARASAAGMAGTTRTATGRRGGFERWLVSFEIALTVILLVSGGLLARSLQHLMEVDPGFEPEGLATASVYLPGNRYPAGPEILGAYDEILSRVEALPGVVRASAITRLPFPGLTNTGNLNFEGKGEGEDVNIGAQQLGAMPGYHETMGIPLQSGQFLPIEEAEDGPRSVVITENIARKYWPHDSPLGATSRDYGYGIYTIVGIAGNVKRNTLGVEPDRAFYYPLSRRPSRSVSLVARTQGNALALAAQMREIIRAFDQEIPIRQVTTMRGLIRESAAQERYRTLLMGVFGALATLLAAVGIFGVTARGVAQRTKEMGVRMSLGAEVGGLVSMMVRASLVSGVVGTLGGLLVTVWTGRLLAGFLFGVDAFDPLTYGAVAGFLVIVSLASSYLPARRIASLDPAGVLRAE